MLAPNRTLPNTGWRPTASKEEVNEEKEKGVGSLFDAQLSLQTDRTTAMAELEP